MLGKGFDLQLHALLYQVDSAHVLDLSPRELHLDEFDREVAELTPYVFVS
jgi:hypothetical protein